jgi:hypothetical protein
MFENITQKDKIPTCSEAAAAINQVMRYIASDITGDGMIVLNNFKETFFEVDNNQIGIKKSLEPDTLYKDWINKLLSVQELKAMIIKCINLNSL